MSASKIPIDNATIKSVEKTTSTGSISCDPKRVSDSPKQIIVWVYSNNLECMLTPTVIATEDGGVFVSPYNTRGTINYY